MDDIMKPHFKKEYGEAEVKKLEQHVDRLESIKERLDLGKKHDTKYSIPNDQAEYLLQRLEIADDVLKFYADLNNYKLPNGHYVETTTVVTSDSGNRARKALEQIGK